MQVYTAALRKRGMAARFVDGKVRISPATLLTSALRIKIRENREGIINELLEEKLEQRGWLAIRSEVIAGVVIIVRDNTVNIPKRFQGCAVYTREELQYLIGLLPETLRHLNDVRQSFGGTIVSPDAYPFDGIDSDPRPDLLTDSEAWKLFLKIAREYGLYEILHGFRCMGATLVNGVVTYDPSCSGFADRKDFDDAYTEWILPNSDKMQALTKRILLNRDTRK